MKCLSAWDWVHVCEIIGYAKEIDVFVYITQVKLFSGK